MQAYDVKRKRIVNVERSEGDVIVAYSLPGEPGIWYFPLIQNSDYEGGKPCYERKSKN